MDRKIDLNRLKDFFDEDDVDWKPIAVSKKTGKALAAAYVTNRAIMDRLDEVCGPENWQNEYRPGPGGGVVCGLSIRVGDEWVTKWDGAENTDVEAVKGGLSTSMRRAAVQWGVGRYIYRLPSQWIPVDQQGRFSQKPRIPAAFLPPHARPSSARQAPVSQAAPAQAVANGGRTEAERTPAAPAHRPKASGSKKSRNGRSAGADVNDYIMPR